MGWFNDVLSGKVDAVPFLENPFNGEQGSDNNQSISGGRTEANNGVYWKGSNGRFYTNDGARGVVDRGTNYSPPGGYKQIADPNPGKKATNEVTPPPTDPRNPGGAAAKVLDEAQLRSLDSYLSNLDTIRDQGKQRARLTRDEARTTKDREKEREEGKYKGKKVSTLQDFAGAKTDTDLGTRDTLENLVSSLSVMGLGGGRALQRQILDAANKSNRKANATQAQNQQGLDTAWNEYDAGYTDDITKIEDQLKFESGEADRKWGQERQNTLQKKADVYKAADHNTERAQIMGEADGLNNFIGNAAFMNPQYKGASRAMATPELGEYQQDIAKYDTTPIGADAVGVTPVGVGVTPGAMPGNLAVKAIAINDKDLGIKKKQEGVDPLLGV